MAFVVAETLAAAKDAAELIEIEYDPLPAVASTSEAIKPGAPAVREDCPDNICFTEFMGDREATEEAFAKAHHVSRCRLVINRVTAVTHGAARLHRRLQRR